MGFPRGLDGRESTCYVGDLGSITGSGRSPGEGNNKLTSPRTPVLFPGEFHGQRCLPRATVHSITKSQTRLRNWHCFTYIYSCSCGSAGKESTCSVGDLGLIPCLGRSPGEVKDYPLQYSGLENSTDCIVHGVAKSDFYFTSFFFLLQKYIHCLFFSRNSFPEGHFFFLAWRVSMRLSQKNISSTYQVSKTEQPRCPKESLVIMGLSSATRFEWLSKKAQKTGEQR